MTTRSILLISRRACHNEFLEHASSRSRQSQCRGSGMSASSALLWQHSSMILGSSMTREARRALSRGAIGQSTHAGFDDLVVVDIGGTGIKFGLVTSGAPSDRT